MMGTASRSAGVLPPGSTSPGMAQPSWKMARSSFPTGISVCLMARSSRPGPTQTRSGDAGAPLIFRLDLRPTDRPDHSPGADVGTRTMAKPKPWDWIPDNSFISVNTDVPQETLDVVEAMLKAAGVEIATHNPKTGKTTTRPIILRKN